MSEGKFTFIDFIVKVLEGASAPMNSKEIWEAGEDIRDKITTKSDDPMKTLRGVLSTQSKKPNSRFACDYSVKPVRYFLKGGNYSAPILDSGDSRQEPRERTRNERETDKREILLHPLVCHFLRKNPVFAGGKKVIAKTIDHTKSRSARSRAPDQWAHPDMVGFHMPFGQNRAHENWKDSVAQLNQITDNNALKLYSFELKRKIDRGSYRQSFFQAVSNSSWAHEGYLVAADIHSDAEFRSELGRLSASFGIGIILLDLNDFEDNSKVLFPATQKEILDWEAINKLSMLNPDFNEFIKDVMVSFKEKRILGKFDQLIEEPAKYIKKHKMA